MKKRFFALCAVTVLWLATVLSGSAAAATWGFDASRYYHWSGWGTFAACMESKYLEPGIYGDVWTAYTSNVFWVNGNLSCGSGSAGSYYADTKITVYAGSDFEFCDTAAHYGVQTSSDTVVLGGHNYFGVCGQAGGPKFMSAYADVLFGGAYQQGSVGYWR